MQSITALHPFHHSLRIIQPLPHPISPQDSPLIHDTIHSSLCKRIHSIEKRKNDFLERFPNDVETPVEVEHFTQAFRKLTRRRRIAVHERIHALKSEVRVPFPQNSAYIRHSSEDAVELAMRRCPRFGHSCHAA